VCHVDFLFLSSPKKVFLCPHNQAHNIITDIATPYALPEHSKMEELDPVFLRYASRSFNVASLDNASSIDSVERLIQTAFKWTDAEADENIHTLFPQGINQQVTEVTSKSDAVAQKAIFPIASNAYQNAVPPEQSAPAPAPVVGAAAGSSSTPPTAVVSPFLGLSSSDLLGPAAAAGPDVGSPSIAAGASPSATLQNPELQHMLQLCRQQIVMSQAQQELMQQQARWQQQQQQQISTVSPVQQEKLPSVFELPTSKWQSLTTGLHQQQVAHSAVGLNIQQQQQQVLQQHSRQHVSKRLHFHGMPVVQQQQQQQQQQSSSDEGKPPATKRGRGRPPKADGQYSQAYLALKKYRARKRDEVSCCCCFCFCFC
jgi:hypothetical protein